MWTIAVAGLLSFVVLTGSSSAASVSGVTPTSSASVSRMGSPLPPAGAAGIKQAQGTDWSGPLLGAAVTGGIFLALLLLIDGDDTGPATSTSTSP